MSYTNLPYATLRYSILHYTNLLCLCATLRYAMTVLCAKLWQYSALCYSALLYYALHYLLCLKCFSINFPTSATLWRYSVLRYGSTLRYATLQYATAVLCATLWQYSALCYSTLQYATAVLCATLLYKLKVDSMQQYFFYLNSQKIDAPYIMHKYVIIFQSNDEWIITYKIAYEKMTCRGYPNLCPKAPAP
jgi:hypothetical protein